MSSSEQIILNHLSMAIVYFNNEGELLNYNSKLQELWKLEDEHLSYNPNIIEFYEIIRETGVYPEKDDFRSFIQNLYNNLIQGKYNPQQYNIILNHEKSLIEKHIPTEDGLLIIWEDNTNQQHQQHLISNLSNINARIIDKNYTPMILVNAAGYIEKFNNKFIESFTITTLIHLENEHIRDVINDIQEFVDFPNEKASIIGYCVNNDSFNYKIILNKNTVHINGIYLPNNTMLVSFNQNNLETSALVSKSTLDAETVNSISNLQNSLIKDLTSIITNPISSIIGLSDILQHEYMGKLTHKQKDYLLKIEQAAKHINKELNHKIELTELEELATINSNEIDIQDCIPPLIQTIRSRLEKKNIKFNLEIKDNIYLVNTNQTLFCKAISLIMLYLIDQNSNNNTMLLHLNKKKEKVVFTIQDNCSTVLFNKQDEKRYDIKLAFTILEKLNISYDYSYKNKSYRTVSLIVENTINKPIC